MEHLFWTSSKVPRNLDTKSTSRLGVNLLRTTHPALRRSDFFDGNDHNGNGLKDVTWVRDNGQEADAGYLADSQNHFIAFRLDGTEVGDPSASIFVAYNGFFADIPATLPANLPGNRWYLVADTASALEGQDNFA